MKHETKLLTPKNVASILSMKPRTVTRWCREGRFKSARKIGRVWRIPVDDHTLHVMLDRQASKELGMPWPE